MRKPVEGETVTIEGLTRGYVTITLVDDKWAYFNINDRFSVDTWELEPGKYFSNGHVFDYPRTGVREATDGQ